MSSSYNNTEIEHLLYKELTSDDYNEFIWLINDKNYEYPAISIEQCPIFYKVSVFFKNPSVMYDH